MTKKNVEHKGEPRGMVNEKWNDRETWSKQQNQMVFGVSRTSIVKLP